MTVLIESGNLEATRLTTSRSKRRAETKMLSKSNGVAMSWSVLQTSRNGFSELFGRKLAVCDNSSEGRGMVDEVPIGN